MFRAEAARKEAEREAEQQIAYRELAQEELKKYSDHLEEMVAERTRELEVANKELDAFSYSAAHDLRAPVRAIIGFHEILISDCANQLDEDGKHTLGRIRESADRLHQLINDLLDLSRLSRKELVNQRVDVSQLAKKAAADLLRANPDRKAEFVIAPDMTAYGDSHLLGIVLDNLIGNAWKFTTHEPVAKIEVGSTQDAYFVRDNGVGFNMDYAAKLFRAFERLHSEQEFLGSGIGLATVFRVIERHRGRVWAEATPGEGATFVFALGGEPD